MKILPWFIILSFLFVMPIVVQAEQRVLINRPVKLDDSGRPMYNSWDRYEQERMRRYEQKRKIYRNRNRIKNNHDKPVNTSQKTTNEIPQNGTLHNSATTPSTAITNRPQKIKGEAPTTIEDYNF